MGKVKDRQTSFARYAKPLDKNGQLRGAIKGEKRKGVGRPARGPRSSERHRTRPRFHRAAPHHVVVRIHADIPGLRRAYTMAAIRCALDALAKRQWSFRIVHFSVQDDHLHLIVEADNQIALAKGMQAFGISAARRINRALRGRRGTVFPDRYHANRLSTPRQVRNCLAYVLNNWRHHGKDRAVSWKLDPYSSAVTFDGWRDGRFAVPPGYTVGRTYAARTWLLRAGWRRRGLIATDEVPG